MYGIDVVRDNQTIDKHLRFVDTTFQSKVKVKHQQTQMMETILNILKKEMALNFPPFGYSEIRMEMSVGREEKKKKTAGRLFMNEVRRWAATSGCYRLCHWAHENDLCSVVCVRCIIRSTEERVETAIPPPLCRLYKPGSIGSKSSVVQLINSSQHEIGNSKN